MIEKMVMTGAMCVVAQGSSVQLLIAILEELLRDRLSSYELIVVSVHRLSIGIFLIITRVL